MTLPAKQYDIPVYQPDLSGNEKKYVNECLDTSWISSKGRFVNEFEISFAKKVDTAHAISVCNGTVALHLALLALRIKPGDEIIVPSLTYVASVNAISYCNAVPVFADCLQDSWQIDPEDIKRKISPRTRAIMVVHLYGQMSNMDALMQIARDHRLFVIEDCAEAFGSRFAARHAGTFGDISTFSFFGNKTITTGEGGMVVTNSPELADRVRRLRGQGLVPNREYWHDVVGYNYRMTNIQAAIGLAQLERSDEIIARKRQIAKWYEDFLAGLPVKLHQESPGTFHSYWMVSLLVNQAKKRDLLRQHLAASGIETRPLFFPVHTMPMYSQRKYELPVAVDIASRGINLPSWPNLSRFQVQGISQEVAKFYAMRAVG